MRQGAPSLRAGACRRQSPAICCELLVATVRDPDPGTGQPATSGLMWQVRRAAHSIFSPQNAA